MMVGADLCPEPVIPNGRVNGVKKVDTYFGEISCDSGFHLVGTSKKIKCRQGRWSPVQKRAALTSTPCEDSLNATCLIDKAYCNQYTEKGAEMEKSCPGTCGMF